jgi:SAM-dependent methyltransferase
MDWEKDIYSKNQQLNNWPFSDVVSFAYKFIQNWKESSPPRLLELGSGAGNNITMLARLGFEVTGIEYSKSAVDFANDSLDKQNLNATIFCEDLNKFDFTDMSFDVILDRGTLTHIKHSDLINLIPRLYSCLKPSGEIHSFTMFGSNYPDKVFGIEIEPNTFTDFRNGFFNRYGTTTFFNFELLNQLFCAFRSLSIKRHVTEDNEKILSEVYSLLGVK